MFETFLEFLSTSQTAETFLTSLTLYGYGFVYLGTVLLGEIVILPSFVLAGQGVIDFWPVFSLAVLGTFTTDIFWYIVGRTSLHVFKRAELQEPPTHFFTRFLHTLTGKYLFLTLLGSKFIIGGRLLTILYIARTQAPSLLFAPLDFIGISLFVGVLACFGWTSGQGTSTLFPDHPVMVTVGVCVLLIAFLYGLQKIVAAKLDRTLDKQDQNV